MLFSDIEIVMIKIEATGLEILLASKIWSIISLKWNIFVHAYENFLLAFF